MSPTQPHEPMIVARVADQLYTCFVCIKCKYSSVYLGVPKYTDYFTVHAVRLPFTSGHVDPLALIVIAVFDVDLLDVDAYHTWRSRLLRPTTPRGRPPHAAALRLHRLPGKICSAFLSIDLWWPAREYSPSHLCIAFPPSRHRIGIVPLPLIFQAPRLPSPTWSYPPRPPPAYGHCTRTSGRPICPHRHCQDSYSK